MHQDSRAHGAGCPQDPNRNPNSVDECFVIKRGRWKKRSGRHYAARKKRICCKTASHSQHAAANLAGRGSVVTRQAAMSSESDCSQPRSRDGEQVARKYIAVEKPIAAKAG